MTGHVPLAPCFCISTAYNTTHTLPLHHRYFGTNRVGSNLVPDDINGLRSTHMHHHLASDTDTILYEGEIDHGRAFECWRPYLLCTPLFLPWILAYFVATGIQNIMASGCRFWESCCWVRKE